MISQAARVGLGITTFAATLPKTVLFVIIGLISTVLIFGAMSDWGYVPLVAGVVGGILTDLDGWTTVPGLAAVGECASTGLHGANRLASNSPLEAVVVGRRLGARLAVGDTGGGRRPTLPGTTGATVVPAPRSDALPGRPVGTVLTEAAGVVRDEAGLTAALCELSDQPGDDALVARVLCAGALVRRETRGGHTRADHPEPAPTASHTLARVTPAGEIHLVLVPVGGSHPIAHPALATSGAPA